MLVMVALLLTGVIVAAQSALPPGVTSITFGEAVRTKDSTGLETCRVAKPVEPPVFRKGTTQITYAVELEPLTVKSASAQLITMPPQQSSLVGPACNIFSLVRGGFSQTQIGNTISRADNAPLAAGVYTLRVTVDGRTTEVSFTVK